MVIKTSQEYSDSDDEGDPLPPGPPGLLRNTVYNSDNDSSIDVSSQKMISIGEAINTASHILYFHRLGLLTTLNLNPSWSMIQTVMMRPKWNKYQWKIFSLTNTSSPGGRK
jgi:hypothetical protein